MWHSLHPDGRERQDRVSKDFKCLVCEGQDCSFVRRSSSVGDFARRCTNRGKEQEHSSCRNSTQQQLIPRPVNTHALVKTYSKGPASCWGGSRRRWRSRGYGCRPMMEHFDGGCSKDCSGWCNGDAQMLALQQRVSTIDRGSRREEGWVAIREERERWE